VGAIDSPGQRPRSLIAPRSRCAALAKPWRADGIGGSDIVGRVGISEAAALCERRPDVIGMRMGENHFGDGGRIDAYRLQVLRQASIGRLVFVAGSSIDENRIVSLSDQGMLHGALTTPPGASRRFKMAARSSSVTSGAMTSPGSEIYLSLKT
jgi:hypothetical protein